MIAIGLMVMFESPQAGVHALAELGDRRIVPSFLKPALDILRQLSTWKPSSGSRQPESPICGLANFCLSRLIYTSRGTSLPGHLAYTAIISIIYA